MQKWLFIIQAKNTKVIIYYISINAKVIIYYISINAKVII